MRCAEVVSCGERLGGGGGQTRRSSAANTIVLAVNRVGGSQLMIHEPYRPQFSTPWTLMQAVVSPHMSSS